MNKKDIELLCAYATRLISMVSLIISIYSIYIAQNNSKSIEVVQKTTKNLQIELQRQTPDSTGISELYKNRIDSGQIKILGW